MFISILYIGVTFFHEFGTWSFSLHDLVQITTLSRYEKLWLFFGFMIAFAIKIPLFPFHTWLLETYSNSPTGGVFLLSSIMAKLGIYGIVRFVMPLFPDLYIEFSKYFDGVFCSAHLGVGKPDKEFYEKVYEELSRTLDVAKDEIFYFDDEPACVQNALKVGFRAKVFVDEKDV